MATDMGQQRSLALLWNNSSGWSDSDQVRQQVETVLRSNGSRIDVHKVERGMNILEESSAIAAGGADVLIAAGGDGTINAAASALIHQATALGVIPAGTLNHFARDLQIPLEAEQAAQALVDGRIIQVDAATVNDRVFINNAVLGLFPNYRSVREAWERHGFGSTRVGRFIATVAAVWRVFWRLPHLHVSLTMGSRKHTLRTPFVLVGNNEHEMQGWALGHRGCIDKGMLWVYAMRPCSRWQMLRLLVGLIFGRAPRESIFSVFHTPDLTIDARKKSIGVGVDGEMVRMKAPLRFKSLPGALKVVAPSSYLSSSCLPVVNATN
jgi:diacylglycerol kinase family enzyme